MVARKKTVKTQTNQAIRLLKHMDLHREDHCAEKAYAAIPDNAKNEANRPGAIAHRHNVG